MSGKRYFTRDPQNPGWYELPSGAQVHAIGGMLCVRPKKDEPVSIPVEVRESEVPEYDPFRSTTTGPRPKLRGGQPR